LCMTSMAKSTNNVLTKYLLSQSTQSDSEDDDALEIEPVTLQLQHHRFSMPSQAVVSLEPTLINVRIACGKPPQNTFCTGRSPHKISVRWGRPREIQRPCRALRRPASGRSNSIAQFAAQCALPKQEVTDIFPHVPSFRPAGTLLLSGVKMGKVSRIGNWE